MLLNKTLMVVRSFKKHRGRKGERGGSLPASAGSAEAPVADTSVDQKKWVRDMEQHSPHMTPESQKAYEFLKRLDAQVRKANKDVDKGGELIQQTTDAHNKLYESSNAGEGHISDADQKALWELDRKETDAWKSFKDLQDKRFKLEDSVQIKSLRRLGVPDFSPFNFVADGPQTRRADVFIGNARKASVLTNYKTPPVKVGAAPDVEQPDGTTKQPIRAYYSHNDGKIYTTDATMSARTMVHEFGHHLEKNNPEIHEAALDFLWTRAGYHEEAVNLQNLQPERGFESNEYAFKDHFADSYSGKTYSGASATEIISMGLEGLFANATEFALKDPDYFHFMYNVLRKKNGS